MQDYGNTVNILWWIVTCNKKINFVTMELQLCSMFSCDKVCNGRPNVTAHFDITDRESIFGGAYGDARMPNWPHWHRTPLPGIATTGLHRDKGGQTGNTIYPDATKVHVFYSSLHVEQALADYCMLIIAWDTPIWREAALSSYEEWREVM